MESLVKKLELARTILADVASKQVNLSVRYAAALAAHDTATNERNQLVADAANGAEIAPKSLVSANAALAAAWAEMQLWVDASAGAADAKAAAESEVHNVLRQIADLRFSIACEKRITAAERLQKAGQQFNSAFQAFRDSEADMGAAHSGLKKAFGPNQLETLQAWRDAVGVLSPAIQEVVMQRRSIVVIDISQRERATWGEWAARANFIDHASTTRRI